MNHDDYDLIDRHLRQQTSDEDKILLETKLEDADFRREFEELLHLKTSIHLSERRRLKSLLQKQERSGRRVIYASMAIAACIILVIAAGYLLVTRNQRNEIFDRYHQPYADLKLYKSRGDAGIYDLKVKAYQFYKDGNNNAAFEQLDEILRQAPNDRDAVFLQGLTYLQEREFGKAISALSALEDYPDAKWYLALAYLGNGQDDETISILNDIVGISTPHSSEARRLLDELSE